MSIQPHLEGQATMVPFARQEIVPPLSRLEEWDGCYLNRPGRGQDAVV